jgi:c-di-GMP-binding flagellar brake protein YcgR
MMVERRTHQRRSLFYSLKVYNADTLDQVGRLVDFTQEGLLLHSTEPVELQQLITLRIPFPSESGKSQPLDLEARCVWSRKDHAAGLFAAGFRFINPTPDERKIIQYVIDNHSRQQT